MNRVEVENSTSKFAHIFLQTKTTTVTLLSASICTQIQVSLRCRIESLSASVVRDQTVRAAQLGGITLLTGGASSAKPTSGGFLRAAMCCFKGLIMTWATNRNAAGQGSFGCLTSWGEPYLKCCQAALPLLRFFGFCFDLAASGGSLERSEMIRKMQLKPAKEKQGLSSREPFCWTFSFGFLTRILLPPGRRRQGREQCITC